MGRERAIEKRYQGRDIGAMGGAVKIRIRSIHKTPKTPIYNFL